MLIVIFASWGWLAVIESKVVTASPGWKIVAFWFFEFKMLIELISVFH